MKTGVFGSSYQSDKLEIIRDFFDLLSRFSQEIYIENGFYTYLVEQFGYKPDHKGLLNETDDFYLDLALSLGGDGTFLRTAAAIGRKNIPILGINTGRLGFLADTNKDEIGVTLYEVFSGQYCVENRTLLQLNIDSSVLGTENFALNEIAILKRDTSSMITIHTFIDGDFLNTYMADGLLIATPTGSTAYSMSVDGPIIVPQARNLVISPVAPHSLNVRPLVIPEDSNISLKVETRSNNFLVALDGRSVVMPSVSELPELTISKADFTIGVIKRLDHTFYQTLRQKLLWGNDYRAR
ncbi:MAG: NAD kinase [Dysgonamonadaceae bacterium]|jgi:NAD+ kinase|nr:NAD kinase [Dysgonamonadaceae bacterium]